jgi:hypothetical protein
MKKKVTLSKVLLAVVLVLTIGTALYIMTHQLGLVDGLDFGAGAYYYADIPNFAKLTDPSHYQSKTPMWVLIVLFLLWGGAMYRLWAWLDKHWKE